MQKIVYVVLLFISFCSQICALNYDVIYVINLDRNPERVKKMKKQLDLLGIKFKVFKAVDGYNITIVNMRTKKIENNRLFHKNCTKNQSYRIRCEHLEFTYTSCIHRTLCCGELGCALSHLSVMKDIVKNNYKGAVILEDDILFEDSFKNTLIATLANTPNDADILYLDVGVIYDYSSPYFVSPGELLRCFEQVLNNKYVVSLKGENECVYGTHAYFITLNGAKKVLKPQTFAKPIDNHLITSNLRKYVTRKKILYIDDRSGSEIHHMGRNFSITSCGIVKKWTK